jgi:hypothetical protein
VTAPAQEHDVIRYGDYLLTVDHRVPGGVDVTEWTGGPHHTIRDGAYTVVYRHHPREGGRP